MTVLLRALVLLLTSRFHAGVLSLAAQVPQNGAGHDFRLDTLYRDLGLRETFFFDSRSPRMFEEIKEKVDRLTAHPCLVRDSLQQGYEKNLSRAQRNSKLLRAFVQSKGWEAVEAPEQVLEGAQQ